jgi:hypothetical protein
VPLGYGVLMEFPGVVGFGFKGKPDFWLREGKPGDAVQVAFAAPNRAIVGEFHAAALAAGGEDNGAPGRRSTKGARPTGFEPVTSASGGRRSIH